MDQIKMKKLLVVVDMQNDFIDGSLGTEEAKKIVPAVVKKIQEYQGEDCEVLFTMDTHYENYLETLEGNCRWFTVRRAQRAGSSVLR